MASKKTTFAIDGLPLRETLSTKYTIKRDADSKGQPSSDIQGGIVFVDFMSNAHNGELAKMLSSSTTGFKASINYYSETSDAKMKELSMEGAFITNFHEHIDTRVSTTDAPAMVTHLIISAQKITVGTATHENLWPKS
jgi:hypothetical protein